MSAEALIKEHLKKNGISQSFLAKTIGMAEPILCMALNEKRKLTLDEYATICGVLGVNTDKFLKPRMPEKTKN